MGIIRINNLGPVEQCSMNLESLCVLTGPQASGKSSIAKAIFFFRTIKEDCLTLYEKRKSSETDGGVFSRTLKKHLRGKFMQMFGSSWGMSMDMSMSYEWNENTYVKLGLTESTGSGAQNYIEFEFSKNIIQLLKELNTCKYERAEVSQKRYIKIRNIGNGVYHEHCGCGNRLCGA